MLRNLLVAILLLCTASLVAQDAPPPNANPSPMRPGRRGGAFPCWREAGIEHSAIDQLWSIQREMHSEVENVCSNSSLTPQQKHQQVQEIRARAHQKVESLITPNQLKELEACRQARGEGNPGILSGVGGGCGGEWQRGGPHPGNGAPGGGNGSGNPPPSNQSAPQN